MTAESFGLIIGGLIPAILFGFTAIFTKASTHTGIGLGLYLILTGL